MNVPQLMARIAILMFTAGGLLAFCKLRDWYLRRGMPRADVVVETPAPDVETYPQTRFSLRRDK